MINQNFGNITQSGTEQTINADAFDADITPAQFYCVLGSLTIILIVFLTFLYLLFKTFINKSCVGCKRLAKCEKNIKDIQEKIELNGYFDKDWVLSLSEKIDKLQEDITNG